VDGRRGPNSWWATDCEEEEAARPRFGKMETNTEIARRRGGDSSILRIQVVSTEATGDWSAPTNDCDAEGVWGRFS
jgi:hypothetical protein